MQLNSKYKYHLSMKISFILLLAMTIFISPSGAYAADGAEALTQVLCEIVSWFTGYVGKAIATLAIISLGLGALFGKLDPGRGIIIVCGIAFMFGAADILEALSLDGLTVTPCKATTSEASKKIAKSLCEVADLLQTDVGRAIMIASVIILGIMSLFGKISYGIGIMLVAGIGIIVGSAEIADELAKAAGGAGSTCADAMA